MSTMPLLNAAIGCDCVAIWETILHSWFGYGGIGCDGLNAMVSGTFGYEQGFVCEMMFCFSLSIRRLIFVNVLLM